MRLPSEIASTPSPMYAAHFGFTDLPFRPLADPRELVQTQAAGAALGLLQATLEAGDPIIALLGERGVGKSAVVSQLAAVLPSPPWRVAVLPAEAREGDALVHAVAQAFDVELTDLHDPLARLTQLLRPSEGPGPRARALLVMEDADDIGLDGLQWLQRLTRLHRASPPALQVLLVAATMPRVLQDGLAGMEPMLDSVVTLQSMDRAQTGQYLHHRLRRVGWQGQPAFDEATVQAIQRHTGGLPARVNTLADRLLLQLFLQGRRELQPGDVEAVAAMQRAEAAADDEGMMWPPSPVTDPRASTPASAGEGARWAGPVPWPAIPQALERSSVSPAPDEGDGPPLLKRASHRPEPAPPADNDADAGEPGLSWDWQREDRLRTGLLAAVAIAVVLTAVVVWRNTGEDEGPSTRATGSSPPLSPGSSGDARTDVQGAGTEAARPVGPPTAGEGRQSGATSARTAATPTSAPPCTAAQDAMGLCTSPLAPATLPATSASAALAQPTAACDTARAALGLCPSP